MTSGQPAIEPYDPGLLDVGDGNHVYWETCGNPDGNPALMVHGGPGSGCSKRMRRAFDQDRDRGGAARPAGQRAQHPARLRPGRRYGRQHHPST
jgi:hypothetical protein